jgi:hypothetical protein
MIEPGPHLWRCMANIELNMDRARLASHPAQWSCPKGFGTRFYERMNKINRIRDEVGNAGFDSLSDDDSDSRFLILRIL